MVGLRTCLALLTSSRSSDITAKAPVVQATGVAVTVTAAVAATAAAFEVALAAVTVAGVGRFAADVVLAINGEATSAFPDKSIQKLFASVRADRRALPKTLARYVIGRAFWMARMRGRSLFVSR
jgi:3-methyladenine DNA glycosylase/8-oxoguanine DNA glycosylase